MPGLGSCHRVWPAGHDRPFTNNYGVWTDEFAELGLEDTLEATWPEALSFFGEGKPVRLERGYGRRACALPGRASNVPGRPATAQSVLPWPERPQALPGWVMPSCSQHRLSDAWQSRCWCTGASAATT